MARLALPFLILRNARRTELKLRRNERRLARYMDRAFSMGEEEFRANYRVTKNTFNLLLGELEPLMRTPRRRSEISSKFKILVTLSFFATGSYQRLVGGTYGTLMSQQSASRAIREVTDALNNNNILGKWIRFPQTQQERDHIKRRFYEKFHIPEIIGCVDGTHVAIIKPTENEDKYINQKHFHSTNVLIICDADLNILSVDASFGGASPDSFVWNQHPVKTHMMQLIHSGEDVCLLGDSGYAQRAYMMTPIVNAEEGSPEDHYMKMHCAAHNTVKHTIQVLKNQWQCLLGHRMLHYHPDRASKIINACCVLHNICNRQREVEDDGDIEMPVSNDVSEEEPPSSTSAAAELRRGLEKRAALVRQLWAARRLY